MSKLCSHEKHSFICLDISFVSFFCTLMNFCSLLKHTVNPPVRISFRAVFQSYLKAEASVLSKGHAFYSWCHEPIIEGQSLSSQGMVMVFSVIPFFFSLCTVSPGCNLLPIVFSTQMLLRKVFSIRMWKLRTCTVLLTSFTEIVYLWI